MSKNRGGDGGFQNRAARFFHQDKIKKIQRASEPEIMELLDGDMPTIIEQLVNFQNHERGAKFPTYLKFIFQNISSTRFIRNFIHHNRKKMSKADKAALRLLIETGYKETVTKALNPAEDSDRIRLLMGAYNYLYPKRVKKVSKTLKIHSENAAELAMFTQSEPWHNIRNAARILDSSDVPTKRKLKLLEKLVGDNLEMWLGAFLTVNKKSDIIDTVFFDVYTKASRKKRYRILGNYAVCFKYNPGTAQPLLSKSFQERPSTGRIIKKLIKEDLGFKKAFVTFFNDKARSKKKRKDEERTSPKLMKMGDI